MKQLVGAGHPKYHAHLWQETKNPKCTKGEKGSIEIKNGERKGGCSNCATTRYKGTYVGRAHPLTSQSQGIQKSSSRQRSGSIC